MKKIICHIFLCLFSISLIGCSNSPKETSEVNNNSTNTLVSAFKDKFYIGVALNRNEFYEFNQKSAGMIKKHFNSIVAENCMKAEKLQPEEGKFFFDDADKFMEFGKNNNMHIVGHTLIWHSQAPRWFFTDAEGKDVSREVLIERMKKHITTVVGRYKGRVKGWDVVNEAVEDNGELRKSKYYQIIGEDYIELAFKFAYEADPEAELYYNDFSMAVEGKRNKVVEIVNSLKAKGIKIDGVGMQGHLLMDSPNLDDFEASILAYSSTGAKVMITELDLSPLPSPWSNLGANISDRAVYNVTMNPYPDGLPEEVVTQWENKYIDFFKLFLKHSDKITRVTLWGLSDDTSWKNDFPIHGRTDYTLLFDRNYEPKPLIEKLIQLAKTN